MREILFRGKHSDNKWYYGSLIVGNNKKVYISSCGEAFPIEVYPETVGQFTGLTDKNGKRIFEGDIMSGKFSNYVFWYDEDEKGFCYGKSYKDLCRHSCSSYAMSISESEIDIIGNIHDNPELLKGE